MPRCRNTANLGKGSLLSIIVVLKPNPSKLWLPIGVDGADIPQNYAMGFKYKSSDIGRAAQMRSVTTGGDHRNQSGEQRTVEMWSPQPAADWIGL